MTIQMPIEKFDALLTSIIDAFDLREIADDNDYIIDVIQSIDIDFPNAFIETDNVVTHILIDDVPSFFAKLEQLIEPLRVERFANDVYNLNHYENYTQHENQIVIEFSDIDPQTHTMRDVDEYESGLTMND